jgi:hypothetical protein
MDDLGVEERSAMAKRTTPRGEANDSTVAASRAKSRRTTANTSPEADTVVAYPGVERSEDDGAVAQAVSRSGPSEIGRAPSDEEIRERAYHRYLERGGHHGSEFDDWVEAERELRSRR